MKKGIKKGLIRAALLLLLFVVTIALTALYINRDKTVATRGLEGASLPILYMEVSNTMVNPMYGYAAPMDEQSIRDSLTPLPTDRILTVVIDPMDSKWASIAYRVSTADGTTEIETGKISKLKADANTSRGSFQLETPILMNQEYTLRFDMTLENGETYYYYTRIIQRSGIDIDQYLDYTTDFYEKCINGDSTSTLASSLEPDETETNSTYASLNIHSSYDRITWGVMEPKLVQKAIPVIKDMNETTCSILLNYIISDQREDMEPDYYMVEDFYRMKNSQSRTLLIDFERSTQELFDGEHTELSGNGLNLGIVDKDIQYQSNLGGDIVAFVQQGELWSYNRSVNKITRIFSFQNGERDQRELLQQHGIKIVRVEESGDIDFVVYGRMNGDRHEGEVGIAVYHYGAELNCLEETMFIPMDTAYEYLKNDMEILSYVTQDDMLYLMLEDDLYQVDMTQGMSRIVQENMVDNCYSVSRSQRMVAWMNEMQEYNSTSITVMDLEAGETYTIQAGAGQKLRLLGFINDDVIYGLANEDEIVYDNVGNVTFAMCNVRIERFGGEVIKDYHQDGIWVSNVIAQEGLLELERIQLENGAYVPINSDHIMNNLQTNNENISIRLIVTERKATQIGLDFDKSVSSSSVLYMTSNLMDEETPVVVELDASTQGNNLYYVYAKGKLDSTWGKVSDAISRADQEMGVVLNRQQQYVWERCNRADSYLIDIDTVPEVVLSGTIDENTLQQLLGEEYTVLNMTDCSLDSVLYLVSKGNPVIARISDGVNVVIVGYDRFNTILYYPATREQKYLGLQDSKHLFEQCGNVFMGYMDNMGAPSKAQ